VRDTTLLILAAAGLGAYYLYTRPPVAATTTTPTQPVNPYAGAAGYYPPPQTNVPRDPGDTNNWTSGNTTALIGAIGSIGGALINTYGGASSTGQTGTPEGWVDPFAGS
jgi:hypothetical protein